MPKLDNITENIGLAQNIDFVNQFGMGVQRLLEVLNVHRIVEMPIGSVIKTYKSVTTLQSSKVEKGDLIPLSKVEITVDQTYELDFDKKRKAVALEDIQKFGFEKAVSLTDSKLVKELQKNLRKDMVTNIETGKGTAKGKGVKGALARGWANVQTVFDDEGVNTVAFVNPMDIADELEKTNVTVQKEFGFNYIQNFNNIDVVIITSLVPAKKLYVTASENLVLAYAKMNNAEVNKAFPFTTDETAIIGVAHNMDLQRLTSETIAVSAKKLFAERSDGVFKVTIEESVEK